MAVPLTVIICCANVADTLEAACTSVAWADELIVVDSGSTDATSQIAQRYAHRYVVEPWRGHSGQKRFAAELAKHDWIFFLDGDEECSPELGRELAALSSTELERYDLMLTPRRNYVMRKRVRAWWPDELTRVFHRRRCGWSDEVLHDTRSASDPSRVRRLRGWIIHKRLSDAGFSDYFSGQRLDGRLLPVAMQMHQRGKRCHWWDLALRPGLAFFKSYVIKRGFLDGTFGLLMAQKSAVSTQLKYAALWAVQHRCHGKSDQDKAGVAR
ncbi:MAG: glycosyltransferase family 2 protein [Phycisphaeraceae bacterium]|nr:glycosyltransferase family 2 protein [Phycisphaeraceae bacterium]